MDDSVLDLRGLRCPLPVLRTKKALAAMAPGARLLVDVTDPGALEDLRDLCRLTGHVLLGHEEHDGVVRVRLERGHSAP